MARPAEFDLIARIRARASARPGVALGIGDDAALLDVPAGMQLAVTMDQLNAGVHFPHGTAPFDIGWKALAVNLSDLAAMAAQPAFCTLALALPEADAAWLDAFLDGFMALAEVYGIALVGGDTTRGPLSACITAHGLVPAGVALRRDGARAGDDVWVSGTLGDAALALPTVLQGEPTDATLRERLERPVPRVALGLALRGMATACIDVSDGLLADASHVARASDVGIVIDVDALPASPAARHAAPEVRRTAQATGGDDYELCFTVPRALRDALADGLAGTQLTRIGEVVQGTGVHARRADARPWQPPRTGHVHFGA